MKALEWRMFIPKNRQTDFVKWFKEKSGPILGGFGAIKHELYLVENTNVLGDHPTQTTEEDRFIERIYFEDDFNLPDYFLAVAKDPEANKLSKMYREFRAKDVELRLLFSA